MAGPEIDIRADLLSRHRHVMQTLAQISQRFAADRWVLVGGMMVMVLGREHQVRSPRAEGTKDADIVVDLIAHPSILKDVAHFLRHDSGYDLADAVGSPGDVARCTFASQSAQIDVLCPNDAEPEALDIGNGIQSLAIPGGRRALETARDVELYFSDDYKNAELRIPSLAGAIAVKAAAAVDPRTAGSPRHVQDVAFLLTMIAEPLELARELNADDLRLLSAIEAQIADDASAAWNFLDQAQRDLARAAYRLLLLR